MCYLPTRPFLCTFPPHTRPSTCIKTQPSLLPTRRTSSSLWLGLSPDQETPRTFAILQALPKLNFLRPWSLTFNSVIISSRYVVWSLPCRYSTFKCFWVTRAVPGAAAGAHLAQITSPLTMTGWSLAPAAAACEH